MAGIAFAISVKLKGRKRGGAVPQQFFDPRFASTLEGQARRRSGLEPAFASTLEGQARKRAGLAPAFPSTIAGQQAKRQSFNISQIKRVTPPIHPVFNPAVKIAAPKTTTTPASKPVTKTASVASVRTPTSTVLTRKRRGGLVSFIRPVLGATGSLG